ncbi:MAG: type I restriction endonuclease [Rhodoplanes sp.]
MPLTLSSNQFSVTENKHDRRPDVVLFVNGLPLAVYHHDEIMPGWGDGRARARLPTTHACGIVGADARPDEGVAGIGARA